MVAEARIVAARDMDRNLVAFVEHQTRRPEVQPDLDNFTRLHKNLPAQPLAVSEAKRGIEDHLARPRTPHGSHVGEIRYVVEQGLAWVGQARRLKIRYERLPAMHRAFHLLRLALICCKVLQRDS